MELVQKSRASLRGTLDAVKHDLDENMREWRVLLDKDLADYPDIVIRGKKQELKTEYESLMRAKAKIEANMLNTFANVRFIAVPNL